MSGGLLIIGSSQAGVQLAVALRALGYSEPITLLGDENHRPYQRPALSKEYLQGKISKESLIYRAQDYWDEHEIQVVRNERIIRIDKDADGSGIAHSMSGAEFPFDRLALAVGARARKLLIEGIDSNGVLYLRNADDALELKARVPDVRDVVVIGGGFIGIEAAASLHSMGRTVTVLEAAPRLAGRAIGEETSQFLLEHHRNSGIEVIVDARLRRILSEGDRVSGVELEDGRIIKADLILVGVGVIPNTELAGRMGLECDNGIVVDPYSIASDGVTIAVGDVANLPNPVPGAPEGSRVRFESVNNAVEQAKVAAYSITGRSEEYQLIPWFWSNQGELKLQIAGLSTGADSTVLRHDTDKGRFSVLYYRGEQLLAADCVNSPIDFMTVKAALAQNVTLPADQVADPTVPLKSLMPSKKED